MEIGYIILSCICLFIIIFCAIRLAISPIISNNEDINVKEDNLSVMDLRDIGLFDNDEIADI
ncbi:MAG: hypothetical protein N4A63_13155 [Vallitalea sp.]|jgi:hypothetical protein|nr:hypothetical protein [Vallitalea sp.]